MCFVNPVKDGSFEVHEWCLYNSDILLTLLKARGNFDGGHNKEFNLRKFRKSSIRKVYDSLHGISNERVDLTEAIEIMAYCLDDGKIELDSEFETELYTGLLEQFDKMKNDIPAETLVMVWLYLQTIGKSSEALLMDTDIWNFNKSDFKSAILKLMLDGEIENDAVTLAMKELIVNRLESHDESLLQWVNYIYSQVFINCF